MSPARCHQNNNEQRKKERKKQTHTQIKGPDNPTSQLLPIMSNKCCSGTGKEGKTKEVAEDREAKNIVCEELCVIKLCVKDVCHTIMCVKDLGYRT